MSGPEFRPPLSHAPGLAGADRARRIVVLAAMALGCVTLGLLVVVLPAELVLAALFGGAAVVAILARPFLGLLIYFAIYLLRPGELFPALDVFRVERVVGVVTLVAVVWSGFRRDKRLALDGSWQTRWLFLFLVPMLLSVPFSVWVGRSAERTVDFLKILAFYVMMVQLIDSRRRLRVFLGVFFALMTVIAVSSLRAYFAGDLVFAQGIERAVGITSAGGDPNWLGSTLAAVVPLLLFSLASARGGAARLALVVAVAAFLWTIGFTGSRSSFLGLLAGLGVVWWLTGRRGDVAIVALFAVAVGFLVLPESYQQRYGSIAAADIDESSRLRLETWLAGARMILDRPLTGVGVGAFGTAHHAYSGSWLEAHSIYVQVPAEVGIPGLFVFAAFLVAALRLNRRGAAALRRHRPGWRYEARVLDGLLAGFAVLFVYSVFGHTMLRYTWFVLAALGQVVWRLHADAPPEDGAPAPAHPAGSGEPAGARPADAGAGVGRGEAKPPGSAGRAAGGRGPRAIGAS